MRTYRVREAFFVALLFAAMACNDKGGSAGPPQVDLDPNAGANVDGEEVLGEPGTCQKLCCSDADCPNGASCEAVDDAQGTLGVCTSAGSEWPGAAGAPGNSGTPGSPGELSSSCWSDPDLECNPLTNAGCETGDACDVIDDDPEFPLVVGCAGGDTIQGPGETCDASWGPWCVPGYHCVRN